MANPFPPVHGQDGNGSGKTPPSSYGVWGDSEQVVGVFGSSDGITGIGVQGEGVFGLKGIGVISGVSGESIAEGTSGVFGLSTEGNGVWGESNGSIGPGVRAQNNRSGPGLFAQSASGIGVHAIGGGASRSNQDFPTEVAVFAEGGPSFGIYATSTGDNCIRGKNDGDGFGVVGVASNVGIAAFNSVNDHAAYLASDCCAAYFVGEVAVIGHLSKSSGGFLIDHPLDPANKHLSHSFVESPDMKNIYDGVVVLDAIGEAIVELPAWFERLNSDFRYQLTCIGGYAPIYIAQEVQGNRFKIAGGTPNIRVSWQVTGIRQDAWANAHRIQVEEEKSVEEHGFYLHPELHGAPKEKSIERVRHPQQTW